MGGKKKLGLKQMERMQDKKDEEDKKDKKKEKAGPPAKRVIGVISPDVKNEKVIGEVKKMPVLTPYSVASRFGIRISASKEFLKKLEECGAVQLVSSSHNMKVYKPVSK